MRAGIQLAFSKNHIGHQNLCGLKHWIFVFSTLDHELDGVLSAILHLVFDLFWIIVEELVRVMVDLVVVFEMFEHSVVELDFFALRFLDHLEVD